MDIAGFYDADERRRTSDELTYGADWTVQSDPGATYRANWVVDTGELYLIREPHPGGLLSVYLDDRGASVDTSELTVEILATLPDRDGLEALLDGWETEEPEADSLLWLRSRVTA